MRRLIVCLAWLLALSPLGTAAAPGETPAAYTFGVAPQFDQRKLFAIWKPVIDALTKTTGLSFEFRSATSVPEFEQTVAKGSYDFIYVNPYHLYRERFRQGYIPLVRDVTPLRGVVVARNDSAIRNLTDLDGKTLAVPSPNAIGASMLIRAELERVHGVRLKIVNAKSHNSAYLYAINKLSDAAGGVEKTLAEQEPEIRDALRVVFRTSDFPSHPIAAHPRIPEALRERVRRSGRQRLAAGDSDQPRGPGVVQGLRRLPRARSRRLLDRTRGRRQAMSLRLKLLLPLLAMAALVGAYLYSVWLPRALVEAQGDHLVRVQRHLDSVAEGLIPLLVSGQLDAIHENLSALKHRNKDWEDIRLVDPRGRQLYPLIGSAPTPPLSGDIEKQVVERPISFLDSELGSLKVLIDFSELHARDREHHAEMGIILGLVTLLLILTLGVALELNVGRPVHTLVQASRELARGNYAATLPPPRRDELGALTSTFAAMRADLREHHDSLLQEIDARDRAQREQARLNAALADRESDLRAVTDAVQDAIIRVDEAGQITFWNPGAERLFGFGANQAVGARMHEVLAPPHLRERARNEYELFVQSGSGPLLGQTVEFQALRADGQEFPVELTVSRLLTVKGWNAVGVVRDISERKRTELELIQHRNHLEELVAQRTTELKEKNASLESALTLVQQAQNELIESEKLASLGRLVAGFAHEINTPIGVAVGASSLALESSKKLLPLLQHEEVNEAVLRAHLGEIDEACRLVFGNLTRAADLVGRFKRTSVDQVRGAARLYDLDETITDVIASLHDLVKRTPVNIRVSCAEHINLYGYPGALGQILTNLVINSLHHAFANGTVAGEIELTAAREGEQIVIEVRDNGKGMDARTLSRIFEPFFTTARESGGTGLGLFICHNLATSELKGSLRCDSEPGRGTRFVLRYPAQSAPLLA